METKQKQHPAVNVTGDGSKVWYCKEQYCIGTWNVRSINQGKLEVVKQEMARVNIDILGISELKWTGMDEFNFQFSCSVVSDSAMDHTTPGLPVHHQLPDFTQTHVHWVGDVIQPSLPLSSSSPPALNLSQHQGLFKWVSSSHQWPKYWSFSFNISPSNEHSELISSRMDWLYLLAVHGTLKSLLQHHRLKASVLWHSAFFIV